MIKEDLPESHQGKSQDSKLPKRVVFAKKIENVENLPIRYPEDRVPFRKKILIQMKLDGSWTQREVDRPFHNSP